MYWKQVTDPFDNVALSALVALFPIAFIFWALIKKGMKGYMASLVMTAIAVVIAISVYQMPIQLAMLSTLHGVLYGLFPICWITINAVFLFNIMVRSGQFEVIKQFMAKITSDRRLQVLLIAFCFGSFLEGTAGFATPVAICGAMLLGLGFKPLYAAGICLIANTSPVAFGAMGIPVVVASDVSGVPEMAISQMVGRTLPILSVILPFYLVSLMAGYRKAVEIWPAVVVCGLSFAFLQWFCSNFMGPELPDVIAGLGSIASLLILLRFWRPQNLWGFEGEIIIPRKVENMATPYSPGQILKAWTPFIFLTTMVLAWTVAPINDALNFGSAVFFIPGLHNAIAVESLQLIPHTFTFNFFSASGTAIFLSALFSIPLLGISPRIAFRIFVDTVSQLKFAILTIATILGYAYLSNDSGMSTTLSIALSETGVFFPFFAPMLGWIGVFITGSDTSSNALFGKVQFSTATAIGVDPVITVAANCSGGVVAKMISPQSVAVAAAAGNLTGNESQLFRFTVKHSFIMLLIICVITVFQAYVWQRIVPVYDMTSLNPVVSPETDLSFGLASLLALAVTMAAIAAAVRILNKKAPGTPSPRFIDSET